MSYSISRLTLFAIISSIETDLRNIISTYIGSQNNSSEFFGHEIFQQASERFEKEYGLFDDTQVTIDSLLPYIDFPDAYKIINSNSDTFPVDVSKYIKGKTKDLDKCVPIRNRVFHSRPLLYDDFSNTIDLANKLIIKKDLVWRDLPETLDRLRDEPSFVLDLEIPFYEEDNIKHNLPIPDFDETGFLGRRKKVKDLMKHILGPYPVISLVGDGGIGKTALALRIAYDVLDLPNCPFEAIVWTSSKTSMLTAKEIRRIEGAISSSLDLFKNIADEFTEAATEPIEEVLNYMSTFRILLILDNLETVLDEKINNFLERLPSGSKVLITSRIGVGAFEIPIKIQAMDQTDAVHLMRAISGVRGAENLLRLENSKIEKFCQRLKYSPGFIKWFVSVVQTGMRPEEALSKPDIFLEFCMSNVYNYLSDDARKILHSMLALPGRHSLAEIAYINEMEAIELQSAIYELLRTNMVIMSSTAKGASVESQYEISDLARTYLNRLCKIDLKDRERILKRNRQLVAAGEYYQSTRNTDPYSFYTLNIRSHSDYIVTKYLLSALSLSKNRKFRDAEDSINKARNLAPEYFEVHRVDALVKTAQGNYSAAQSAFEAAIEIEPKSAPLRYWFAGFLMRYMDDTKGSLEQFIKASELDPKAKNVKIEIARAYLYIRDYDQATETISKVIEKLKIKKGKEAKKVYDIYLQCFYRKAESLISQGEIVEAVEQLEKLKNAYEKCPIDLRDKIMKEKIANAVNLSNQCYQIAKENQSELKTKIEDLFNWFANEVEIPITIEDANKIYTGVVSYLPVNRSFGFITGSDEQKIFFHRNEIRNYDDWSHLKVGSRVTYLKGMDRRGPNAIAVERSEKDIHSGIIIRIPDEKKYGFIRTNDDKDYFFHFNSIISEKNLSPEVGDKVSFRFGSNEKGICAIEVVLEK